MKHDDLLGENAQIHNKVYQMMRDRLLKILETALIYGEISEGYFPDVLSLSKMVELEKGEKIIVNITYQDDEHVTMTAHVPDGETVWTYIWSGGLVNIHLAEDAIKILNAMDREDSLSDGYLLKRDAWVQTLEKVFQGLGGVATKRMKASEYVAMRKEGSEE